MEYQWRRHFLTISGRPVLLVFQPMEDVEVIYRNRLFQCIGKRLSSSELLEEMVIHDIDCMVVSDSSPAYVVPLNYMMTFYVVPKVDINHLIVQYRQQTPYVTNWKADGF